MPAFSDRQIPQRQKRDHLEWMHTHRFIEEVHRLEADGRVASRAELERRLLLPPSGITVMRSGKVRVPTAALELLKREFNGDWQYVLLGVRDEEHSSHLRGGRSLRVHPAGGYVYPYQSSGADLRLKAGLPALEPEAAAPVTGRPRAKKGPGGAPLLPAAGTSAYAQLLADVRQLVRQELSGAAPES